MEEKKDEKKQNLQIIILSIIIVILLVALIYALFFKKNEKPSDNQVDSKTEEKEIIAKDIYKTSDGKFTLKIVDNKTAYLNDYKINLSSAITNDENYAVYHGLFNDEPMNEAQYDEVFLVNKKTGLIIESDYYKNSNYTSGNGEAFDRFNSENNALSFVKTLAGYYFTKGTVLSGPVVVYTTSFKELGYLKDASNIKSDAKGIWLYTTIDNNLNLVESSLAQFDINGNKLVSENTTNNTEIGVFKTSDGKNILKDIQKLSSSNEYYGYKGLYNNKKINLAKIDENENYISYSGDMDGADRAQCYTKHFVINKKNNTIINTTIPSVSFIKVKNGYYFKSNGCDILDYPGDVYTSNGKLLGTYLGNTTDNNGNIYVGNSIYSTKKEKGILKYDINGKLLMQENSYHYIRGVIYNNQCYALSNDGKTLYLVNVSTKDKTLLTNIKNRDINDYYDNLTLKGNVITIELSNEEMQFTYDIKTKKITNLNGNTVAVTYKTSDGKHTLRVVDNTTAYYDNEKYELDTDVSHKDENYGLYSLITGGQDNFNVIVNEKLGTIVVDNGRLTCDGCGYNFIKTSAGYYFYLVTMYIDTIYTTNLKEIGYIESAELLKSDKDGIWVYTNSDLIGDLVKFDINGNKIS